MKLEIGNPIFKGSPVELLASLGVAWDGKKHSAILITTYPDGRTTIENLPEDLSDPVKTAMETTANTAARSY